MSAAGPRELTDLERQVAVLVAWGGSNREVAEALGIEVRAVKRHLARVYRKLGIRARAELLPPGPPTSHQRQARLNASAGIDHASKTTIGGQS
jgi:DNA-binding CsgD family transcriptional regulator